MFFGQVQIQTKVQTFEAAQVFSHVGTVGLNAVLKFAKRKRTPLKLNQQIQSQTTDGKCPTSWYWGLLLSHVLTFTTPPHSPGQKIKTSPKIGFASTRPRTKIFDNPTSCSPHTQQIQNKLSSLHDLHSYYSESKQPSRRPNNKQNIKNSTKYNSFGCQEI